MYPDDMDAHGPQTKQWEPLLSIILLHKDEESKTQNVDAIL